MFKENEKEIKINYISDFMFNINKLEELNRDGIPLKYTFKLLLNYLDDYSIDEIQDIIKLNVIYKKQSV